MDRYYKIPKDSETGKKLNEVIRKAEEFEALRVDFAKKYNLKYTYGSNFYLCSVTGVVFNGTPDSINWRLTSDRMCYIPRKRTKDKELLDRWNELQQKKIRRSDIDEIIGGIDPFQQCGFDFSFPDCFYVTIGDINAYDIPADCIEISNIEYLNLKEKQ